jgi:hypothetical protein
LKPSATAPENEKVADPVHVDQTDDAARWWRAYQLAENDQADELRRLAAAGDDHARRPAALPAAAAALLHVSPGDVLTLRDGSNHAEVRFRLTGLFVPRMLSGSAPWYWSVGTIGAGGSRTLSGYTTYGPLLVSPAAFGTALTAVDGTWLAQPDMARFTDTDLSAISGDLTAFMQAMQSSPTLGGLQVSTALSAVLSATASNLSVARSLLVIVALQLLVLAVAALLATARLLVTQREGETALLNARGAGRWQLTRLTAAEVIPLCGLAAVIGGLAGIRLAALLARCL